MSIPQYGQFGRNYVKPTHVESEDSPRRERTITTVVGGQRVTIIVRDTIVPEDPYLNLIRAAAYPYQTAKGADGIFPVPPVSRRIKDVLIKTDLVI